MPKFTIIIPSRNEPYLNKTIKDIVSKAKTDIEIIAILDGWWVEPLITDNRIHYIHFGDPVGVRVGVNSAVAIAKGKYIMRVDAHCMFDEGFDDKLIKVHQHNWVQVPRRMPLNPEKWELEQRSDNKYPIDYEFLDTDMHGKVWREKNADPELKKIPIDDMMSFQGSCWFMEKEYYKELELLDEKTYGKYWLEPQEVGLKCWLSGGSLKVNKTTWYAHWHKDKRGYVPEGDKSEVEKTMQGWKDRKMFSKQIYPFAWLTDKFFSNKEVNRDFCFFTKFGGAGQIRGEQVAKQLNCRLNPQSDYENDICIYVKQEPPENYPKNSYLDIVDAAERLDWLRKHQDIGVICQSETAKTYLEKILDRQDIVLIPEHHCNIERKLRTRTEVKVVGIIGNHSSVQLDIEGLRKDLSLIGIELLDGMYKDIPDKPVTRQDILDFYNKIDIQLVYRPNLTRSEHARVQHKMGDARPLRNPLKLINAMSFGIPTVSYPEEDYVEELDGYFIPATNYAEVIEKIKKLKDDSVLYQTMSSAGIGKAEEYHIENIVKLYNQLKKKEAFMDFKIKGRLWEKEVKVNGFTVPVYGLASFNVTPRSRGFGKQMLIAFEYAAKEDGKYGVVAFCEDAVLSFYTFSGWYSPGKFEGHNIVTSFPVKTIEVTEAW